MLRPRVTERALGLLGLPAPSLSARTSTEDQRISRLLMSICKDWVRHPGLDDISDSLGLSIGRTSEILRAYFPRYHSTFDGWRSYAATMRTELAFGMLDARRSSARAVAEWLGYRAPTSMYHALERRNLKPRSVRASRKAQLMTGARVHTSLSAPGL